MFLYLGSLTGGPEGFPSGQHARQNLPTAKGLDFPIRDQMLPVLERGGGPPQVWFERSYKATMRSLIRRRNHSDLLMFSSSVMRRRASICFSVNVMLTILTGSPMLLGMVEPLCSIILSKPPVFVPKTRFHDSITAAHATAGGDWDKLFGRRLPR